MIDLSQVIDILLGNTPVEQIEDSQGNVLWTATPVVIPNYFYVEDISGSDNTLSIVGNTANVPATEIFKSTDGINWTSMGTTSNTAITATIPANRKLYLKATTNKLATDYNNYVYTSTTGNHNIGGCIASLIFGDNFESGTITNGTNNYAFSYLFNGDTHLVSAANLTLTNSTATRYCQGLFKNCTSLTTPPATLPATTLTDYCYTSMFYQCTALTTAPTLPATALASYCYGRMFEGCTTLITAPALPATTINTNCYEYMFSGCTALTTAPTLSATSLANACYIGMFQNCTALTTAPATLPATTLYGSCYKQMFQNCTALTTAPVLPATTLIVECYRYMFRNCTSLNSVTTYASDISATYCTGGWLQTVAATGDFYNNGDAAFTTGDSGIPSGWTEHTSL